MVPIQHIKGPMDVIPQYKSVQAGRPTGYALNTPGVVGSASVLDDSSRLKYKDGNVYVPNPQVNGVFFFLNQTWDRIMDRSFVLN